MGRESTGWLFCGWEGEKKARKMEIWGLLGEGKEGIV